MASTSSEATISGLGVTIIPSTSVEEGVSITDASAGSGVSVPDPLARSYATEELGLSPHFLQPHH